MNDKSAQPSQDYAALRRLLLGPEIEKLEQLSQRVDVPENFSEKVGEILPQAMLKSARSSDKLSEAMVPTVEEILRLSIKRDINKFADALFPVIGPAIRKSISETFREMLQSLNRTLEQSFSWQGIKWRMESVRSGVPVAQIALLKGLVYRVEQVFLIHRKTGLLLQHLGREEGQSENADMVSSMLSAIRDFAGDSFAVDGADSLGSIEVGELSLWIEQGPDALLAVAIRGEAPNSLRTNLQKTLEGLQFELTDEFENFHGDTTAFASSAALLEDCMQAQYRNENKRISLRTKLLIVALILMVGFWIGWELVSNYRQSVYVDSLQNEPGYIITGTVEEDGNLVVRGLRDPMARSPQAMLAESALSEDTVIHRFDPYYSLQPGFVLARAERILKPPTTVKLLLNGDTLQVSGSASSQWRQQLEDKALFIGGINAYNIEALETELDMNVFSAPDSVSLRFKDGVLYAEGSAENEWIEALRAASEKQSQVRSLNLDSLVNLSDQAALTRQATLQAEQQALTRQAALQAEQQALARQAALQAEQQALSRQQALQAEQQALARQAALLAEQQALLAKQQALRESIDALEQQNIFFDVGGISLDGENGEKIIQLARRVVGQSRDLSRRAVISLQGQSDSIGPFEANLELSLQRAELVAGLLVDAGIARENIVTRGIDAPVEKESNEDQRRYNRRVSFKVIIE